MPERRCIVCDHAGPFPPLFERAGHTLVRCPGCRLVFQEPQAGDDVLASSYYYDPAFTKALAGPLREIALDRARAKLPLVREVGGLRRGGTALDVGCSSGAWLEIIEKAGMSATGIELGAATAEAARERGLDVRTGSLESVAPHLTDQRFDLITFWDVLEHVRDPRRELSLAMDLLAPDGLVAATLPNVEGWYPRLTYRLIARRTGVWEYPELPVHMYDFSPATITRLLERMDYRPVAMRTFAIPFDFYRQTTLSLAALGGMRRPRLLRLAFVSLRAAVYPLARLWDRGNGMFVAAKPSR